MGLLKDYNVTIPRGFVASTPQEAYDLTVKNFTTNQSHDGVVVKAQVLAGGRGKGIFKNGFQGGVHLVTS